MKKTPPRWLQFFLIIACMGLILFYSPLLRIILQMNLLPAKFYRYIARGIALALNPTILRLPFLIPVIMYYDRFCGFREIPGETAAAAGAFGGILSHGGAESHGDAEQAGEEGFDRNALGMFVVLMLLLEICTVQLRSVQAALYRISYYFGYYRFIAYSRLVRILRRDNRVIVAAALLCYLAVLWYYQNVIQGNNQIYPYVYSPGWFQLDIPVMPE